MSSYWEEFGEKIRSTVLDAVENQDYEKLNEMISDTIDQAADTVTNRLKKEKSPKQQSGYGMHYSNVKPAASVKNQQWVKMPSRTMALLLSVVGYSLGVIGIGGLMLSGVSELIFGGMSVTVFMILSKLLKMLSLTLIGTGFALGVLQTNQLSKIDRFKKYLGVIGDREYCNISDLIKKTKFSDKRVYKDLVKMIEKGWFIQGHLDQQKTCLIVTDEMYEQYLRLEQQKTFIQEEKVQQDLTGKNLTPEVQKVIDLGEEYLKKIRACNDAIPGVEISNKIYRIEMLADKIFDRVEREPKCVADIKKMMDYYLPTTVKLLEAYAEMDAQPVGGENIQASKKEIEDTLDTLNIAFEKLLDSLFEETAWDVSADISVLNTMLAQEGLKEDGLRKKL